MKNNMDYNGNIVKNEDIKNALIERHSKTVQDKLDVGRVAIAGLGGLGSNVAYSLTRIGVGHLHLIDFDVVDITNLNRQQYFVRHIGMNKTEALKELLLDINPYMDIRLDTVRVTGDNIKKLFAEDDIICEAFDVPENKAMLAFGIRSIYPDKQYITASGMAGYGDSNSIITKKVGNNFYLCGDGKTAPREGYGLMAPRVAICANHEANLIAKLLIDGTDD